MNTNTVKKIVLMFAVFFAATIALVSCGESIPDKNQSQVDSSRVVLPPTGLGDNEVFNSTGEIVVFFERSPIDLQEKGLDKDAKLQKELEAFRAFANSEINNLKAQGYKCFKSQEKHVKLSVTKSQVYVVNTDTREDHYGVILAKLDTLPKVIAGLPSPEALKLEIEQFYKKP